MSSERFQPGVETQRETEGRWFHPQNGMGVGLSRPSATERCSRCNIDEKLKIASHVPMVHENGPNFPTYTWGGGGGVTEENKTMC